MSDRNQSSEGPIVRDSNPRWRLIIWSRFLFDISRLNLALVPTHADKAGGLDFLGNARLILLVVPIEKVLDTLAGAVF